MYILSWFVTFFFLFFSGVSTGSDLEPRVFGSPDRNYLVPEGVTCWHLARARRMCVTQVAGFCWCMTIVWGKSATAESTRMCVAMRGISRAMEQGEQQHNRQYVVLSTRWTLNYGAEWSVTRHRHLIAKRCPWGRNKRSGPLWHPIERQPNQYRASFI